MGVLHTNKKRPFIMPNQDASNVDLNKFNYGIWRM